MIPIELENPSRRLAAPEGWNHRTDGICRTLEIWDVDGFMVSAWQPTLEDMKRLWDGEPLYLYIKGTVHPVVALEIGIPRPPEPAGGMDDAAKGP